jgi:hypothetical protein
MCSKGIMLKQRLEKPNVNPEVTALECNILSVDISLKFSIQF